MSLVFRNSHTEAMRIDAGGNVGVGIGSAGTKLTIQQYKQWAEIEEMAETNPAIRIALDKLLTVYKLSKDYNE